MASGIGGSHDTIMVKFSKHQTTSGEVTMAKFDFNIKYKLPYQIWMNITLQWTFKDRLNYWTIIDFKLSNLQNSDYWISVFKRCSQELP